MVTHLVNHYPRQKNSRPASAKRFLALFFAGLILAIAMVAWYLSLKKNLITGSAPVTSSWQQYLKEQSQANVTALSNFKTAINKFSANLSETVSLPAPEVKAAMPLPKPPEKFGSGLILK